MKQVCVLSSLGGGSQDSKTGLVNPCPLTHWSHGEIRGLQLPTPQAWARRRKPCSSGAGAQQAAQTDSPPAGSPGPSQGKAKLRSTSPAQWKSSCQLDLAPLLVHL